jgi:hypothetical protein
MLVLVYHVEVEAQARHETRIVPTMTVWHYLRDWLPVSGARGSREPGPVETRLTSIFAHANRWMEKYLRCLSSCKLESFHTSYQSHVGAQSTLAAALDVDILLTNHAVYESCPRRAEAIRDVSYLVPAHLARPTWPSITYHIMRRNKMHLGSMADPTVMVRVCRKTY